MCNCVEETTKLIMEKTAKQPDVKSVNYALLTSTMTQPQKVGVNVLIGYTQLLKNGKEKSKEVSQTIIALYCPFCGKKYDENEQA